MTSGVEVSWVWAIGLITFAFGLAVGVGIGYLALGGGRRTRELEDRYELLQREFDSYRDQVSQHFQRTSELVQNMTQSYRDVYEHLAHGSQALCKEPVDTPRLDIPEAAALAAKPAAAAGGGGDETPRESDSRESVRGYSDAETDDLDDADSDNYFGDAPRVPELEPEAETGPASHRTR
jgi:uncharacterized membrane-anchored protein YhcB (DUF1043 family)